MKMKIIGALSVLLVVAAVVALANSAPGRPEIPLPLLAAPAEERMTVDGLDRVLRKTAEDVKRDGNFWEFTADGRKLACIADPAHDRMRIITPIVRVSDLEPGQKDRMLEANFHTALDARYAVSDGVVYAAFIHPLSPLRERELASALRQVATAANTFGASYSSGELSFGGGKTK